LLFELAAEHNNTKEEDEWSLATLELGGHLNLEDLVIIGEHLIIEHKEQGSALAQSQTDQLELAYQVGPIVISASYQETKALAEFELAEQKAFLAVHGGIYQYAHLGLEAGKADGEENLMLLLSVML